MKKPAAYRAFQVVYALLALNFAIPAVSYMAAPEVTLDTLDRINRALGGGPYPFAESGQVWHMLAVGNVMTLAFMCGLLLADLRRFYPVLPALAFLKAYSAIYSGWIGIRHGCPAFLAIFALDGTTTLAMVFFARAALRAIGGGPPPDGPWWARALLLYPSRIDRALATVRERRLVPVAPNVFQVFLGVVRMQHRLLFRSDTVGTSVVRAPRPTLRARLLALRPLRFPFLVAERAIAPLDLSGMASSRERIIRHLLAAHHDGMEFVYDLELLALHDGALVELAERVRAVVDGTDRRASWLRDLVVFDGYHEALLEAVEKRLWGESLVSGETTADVDVSFFAYLRWCASQPSTPAAAVAAWRRGELRWLSWGRARAVGRASLVWALGLAAAVAHSACYSSAGTQVAYACTLTPPVPPDWRLHADGRLLRDGLGRIVFLRGVDAGGRSKFAPYVPFDYPSGQYTAALDAYMDRAASWGIDAMRVPFVWAALEPTQGADDLAWLAQYQQLIDAAWTRGIWSVVDFHQDIYSQIFCGDGFPAWTVAPPPAPGPTCGQQWSLEYFDYAPVEGAFDAFWAGTTPVQSEYYGAWDAMIARFQNEPGVLGFEPINEPAAGSESETTFEATTLTDFYSKVVPHMRALAPGALVFVDPAGEDGTTVTTSMTRPQGDGIVFAPHYYPITSGEDSSVVLSGLQSWANVGAAWNVPVFLGEFGISHDNEYGLSFMTAHFAALDVLGMSGTEWEYSVSAEEWNSETASVVASDGTEYPVAAALIRPFARAVAGDSIAQAWDPDTRTFTLSYVTSASASTPITELELPARAYPSGYSITLSSGCYDATSLSGRLLVQPEAGATQVALAITSL